MTVEVYFRYLTNNIHFHNNLVSEVGFLVWQDLEHAADGDWSSCRKLLPASTSRKIIRDERTDCCDPRPSSTESSMREKGPRCLTNGEILKEMKVFLFLEVLLGSFSTLNHLKHLETRTAPTSHTHTHTQIGLNDRWFLSSLTLSNHTQWSKERSFWTLKCFDDYSTNFKHAFLLSDCCPIHLLARDLMCKLEITRFHTRWCSSCKNSWKCSCL